MTPRTSYFACGLIASAVATLSACGGGGGGGGSSGHSASFVTGVAATGLAIDKGSIALTCTSGSTPPVLTGADGGFSIDVSGVTLPCVAKVDYTDKQGARKSLRSLVRSVGNVNVTPITDMVVANLSTTGVAADLAAVDIEKYSDQRIRTAIQTVKADLESRGIHSAALPDDVIGTKLEAAHGSSKGDSYDSVLDNLKAKLDDQGKTINDFENEMKSNHESSRLSTSTGQAGDAAAGKISYEATCLSCHGPRMPDAANASKTMKAIQENEGGMGTLLIDRATADNIATYLASGLSSTPTSTPTPAVLKTQTITFVSPGGQTLGVATPALSATADSGLAVTITSTTPAICTVNANTLTLVAAGSCSLTASQLGNTAYAAANNIIVTFNVLGAGVTPPAPTGLIPNATNGKTLYANCSGCHGAAATGGSNVLAGANNALTIQAAISSNLGGMGRLSTLSAQNLADISAYLATPNI